MSDIPHTRHGLIPMLVAIRVTGERRRREAEAEAEAEAAKTDKVPPAAPAKPKKKRGWFG